MKLQIIIFLIMFIFSYSFGIYDKLMKLKSLNFEIRNKQQCCRFAKKLLPIQYNINKHGNYLKKQKKIKKYYIMLREI